MQLVEVSNFFFIYEPIYFENVVYIERTCSCNEIVGECLLLWKGYRIAASGFKLLNCSSWSGRILSHHAANSVGFRSFYTIPGAKYRNKSPGAVKVHIRFSAESFLPSPQNSSTYTYTRWMKEKLKETLKL